MKNLLCAIGAIVAVQVVDAQVVQVVTPPPATVAAVTCMECKGTGRVPRFFGLSKRCKVCNGAGFVTPPPPPPPVVVTPPPPKPHHVKPHHVEKPHHGGHDRHDGRMDGQRRGGSQPNAQNRQRQNGGAQNRPQQKPQGGNGGKRPPQR